MTNQSRLQTADPRILVKYFQILLIPKLEKMIEGAIEAVQPVTAITNFTDILKSDESMLSAACYAVWGFCVANPNHTLSEDMKIKVGNYLNWANIVLPNKEVQLAFVDEGIVLHFPHFFF